MIKVGKLTSLLLSNRRSLGAPEPCESVHKRTLLILNLVLLIPTIFQGRFVKVEGAHDNQGVAPYLTVRGPPWNWQGRRLTDWLDFGFHNIRKNSALHFFPTDEKL